MNFLDRVYHVLNAEASAIRSIPNDTIQNWLPIAAQEIINCQGKVVTTGMGKNGSVARRVASTLSCTGTSAFYMHSGEGSHGDLGMISKGDILLALSNSGKTREVLEVVEKIKEVYADSVTIITITGHENSPLSKMADIALCYGLISEPCPLGLTPSSSLAAMSALLDALALGVMEMRGFTREEFAHRHWSGYLSSKIAEESHE